MDPHPTPFPGNKAQPVKSKYKKSSEAPKQKIKQLPVMQRRTFGTIRNPNLPEKTIPPKQKPKSKPSDRISLKQAKTEPDFAKTESGKKTPQNGKKKAVSFPEKVEGSGRKKSPARESDGVKTPVRPPFCAKPSRVSGTPYVSAEKCSSCRFDRLETAAYWVGQIKSAEAVGKHFVAAAFFRLAIECKAEPAKNLQTELKKYLTSHDYLSSTAEWEDVTRIYGLIKKAHHPANANEKMGSLHETIVTGTDSKLEDTGVLRTE